MIFRSLLWVLVQYPFVSVHADTCSTSVVLVGSNAHSRSEVERSEVMGQISRLYSEALNDRQPMEVVLKLMGELAEREGTSVEAIRMEVEAIEVSPSELQAIAEERLEHREQERSRLYEGLLPYLDGIGREHRKIIEDELILPGFVNPLSTGEVEFHFQGDHRFVIGDDKDYSVVTKVSFSRKDSFAIGQVPVTQFLYFLAALGVADVDPTPSEFKNGHGAVVLNLNGTKYSLKPNHPVESVNWNEAVAHASRVSEILGFSYSLPKEKQWEFANRSGSEEEYHFGSDGGSLHRYAWFSDNSGRQTHAVGELLPNAFHLYDTHGNVREWTSSRRGVHRTVKGGSWSVDAYRLRSAYRYGKLRDSRDGDVGFRLVRPSSSNTSPTHRFIFGQPATSK
jgi:hypothetical protein